MVYIMSLEIKIFAILVFLCALVICIAIRNASLRIADAISTINIILEWKDEDNEEEQKSDSDVSRTGEVKKL